MQQLIIASEPLLTATLKAYHTELHALKLYRNFEHEKAKCDAIDAEIKIIEKLISASEEIIKQL